MSQRSENQTGVPLAQQTLTEVYQLLLQQVTDGIFITNIEGHLLEANPYGCQLLGYTREEVRQLSWPDLWATEASADDPLYQNNLAIGHTANGRRSLRRKDNQLISVDITAHKLTTGNTVWSVHAIMDGQSQEVTLQERLEADEQLAKIVAIAPGVLCLFQLSPDGTATCPYADPAIQDIYGLTPEELAKDASPVLSLIHPHDVAGIQESIAESARTLLPWQAEYRVQHPDKGEIWVEGHSSPERRPDGTVLWHGFLQDITERKKAEIALRTNEAQLTLLTDALPALIAYVDANQCYQFNNQAYVNWFGYTKGELKGRHLEQVLGTAVYQAISSYTEQALAGETVKYETILPYEDEPRYVQAIYVPDRNAQGEVRGYFALVNDITSRKRAEEALYESQERLSLALSASQMGVWEWNIQTDALLWSPECLAILGVESYNKALVAFTDIVHPEDIEEVMAKANLAIVHKTIYEADFRIIRRVGGIRWLAVVGRGV
jgi:PAS domain S-box-containing protein